MKIARFRTRDGKVHVGKVVDGTVYQLSEHCASTDCLGRLVAADPDAFEKLAAVPLKGLAAHALDSVKLLESVNARADAINTAASMSRTVPLMAWTMLLMDTTEPWMSSTFPSIPCTVVLIDLAVSSIAAASPRIESVWSFTVPS